MLTCVRLQKLSPLIWFFLQKATGTWFQGSSFILECWRQIKKKWLFWGKSTTVCIHFFFSHSISIYSHLQSESSESHERRQNSAKLFRKCRLKLFKKSSVLTRMTPLSFSCHSRISVHFQRGSLSALNLILAFIHLLLFYYGLAFRLGAPTEGRILKENQLVKVSPKNCRKLRIWRVEMGNSHWKRLEIFLTFCSFQTVSGGPVAYSMF